jgi:transcriptional regulator with XRE-family HTH domain
MTADEIKSLRQHLCLTQDQFSRLIGCDPSTLCRWENNKQKPLRLWNRSFNEANSIYSRQISKTNKSGVF